MNRIFITGFMLIALMPSGVLSQDGYEYSPLQEKPLSYKNWTLNDLKDDKPLDLRQLVRGKKLVMMVYFASWCPNWRFEAAVAARLYEKYKAGGFEVIGVSEYSAREDVKAFFGTSGPPYPVVTESLSRDDREKTLHFAYRQITGDKRKWGSPWNVFLEPTRLIGEGDLLTEKAWIVNGELIEAEAEKSISERLREKPQVAPNRN